MRQVLLLLALGLVMGGCATAVRGTTDAVAIDSVPPGAEARTTLWASCGERACASSRPDEEGMEFGRGVREGPGCVTPCTLNIARNERFRVTISKHGYETQHVEVYGMPAATGAAGVVGNAILGGVTGLVIDTATGAALDHCPNPVQVTLRPLDRTGRAQGPPPSDPRAICQGRLEDAGRIRVDM